MIESHETILLRGEAATMSDYHFTTAWFDSVARTTWDQIIPQIRPTKILEIGSYEGASTCYLIDTLASESDIEIHCVDTWAGGIEHQYGGAAPSDMASVEARFIHNVRTAIGKARRKVELTVHKGFSDDCLARLVAAGRKGFFDFVYVDGSHQSPDVLCDAILGFKLLRVGGFMAFDDYLWSESMVDKKDPIRCPKLAIDSFTNVFCQKTEIIRAPLYQLYLRKLAD